MKHKKKALSIIGIILVLIIFAYFFLRIYYKNNNHGNNISRKNLDEVERYICNISSYDAIAEVTIKSNKNTNKYLLKQWVKNEETVQEVIEPKNIEGTQIIYKENKLLIKNSNLNLVKIYNNYPYLQENSLFLTDFIQEYKIAKHKTVKNENDEIIFSINKKNKEELYINKDTLKPSKITIYDKNKKISVYILYKEINL